MGGSAATLLGEMPITSSSAGGAGPATSASPPTTTGTSCVPAAVYTVTVLMRHGMMKTRRAEEGQFTGSGQLGVARLISVGSLVEPRVTAAHCGHWLSPVASMVRKPPPVKR